MASTPQPCPAPPACPAPWSSDGCVPQCGPHTWSPDLGMPLDRAASVSSVEQRWTKHADAPAVPQWQPPAPIRTHPRAEEQRQHAQQLQQEQHAQHARPARYLPRAKSGPSQIGGWYTSTDMAAKWMRPATKLARTSSADSARSSYEPQLVSPLRKPARTAQGFQSSVRQARPAVAATTIRVVSSDWTPEGFEKTVGVFASRPQWSPLLRRSAVQDSPSHEGAGHDPGLDRHPAHNIAPACQQLDEQRGAAAAQPCGAEIVLASLRPLAPLCWQLGCLSRPGGARAAAWSAGGQRHASARAAVGPAAAGPIATPRSLWAEPGCPDRQRGGASLVRLLTQL